MSRPPSLSPRKNPRQSRAQATVGAILEATARILTRDGYDGLTTNSVAETAGVSIGSLYQYFPSKEALVAALLQRHADEIYQAVCDALERGARLPLKDALEGVIEAVIKVHAADSDLQRALVLGAPLLEIRAWEEEMKQRAYALGIDFLASHRSALRANLELGLAMSVMHSISNTIIDDAVQRDPERLNDPALRDEIVLAVIAYLTGNDRGSAE